MTGDLTWLPAWRIRELIGAGEISPVDVTEHFLARIAEVDPRLHAFDTVDADGAREQAAAAERAIRDGVELGPLHGVPVAVMDGINVKGYRNKLWETDSSQYDSLCVERVRAAGAIVVGTTATYYWEPLDRPRNPWDPTKDCGNSSRGSAVAVAAGMVPLALGMDGAGSTRLPAAWSGVVGVHPSRGLVPHTDYEHPTMVLTQTVGPMARDTRDCALALRVLAGPDGRDFVSVQQDPPDYLAHLDDGVDGLRVAWTDDYGWSRSQWVEETPALTDFARRAAFGLAGLGAEVAETKEVWEDPRPAMFMLGSVFSAMGYVPPASPEELAARAAKVDEAWGWHSDAPPLDLPEQAPTTSEDYRTASESRGRNWARFRKLFDSHDVLLSTTTPMLPRPLAEWGLAGRDYTMTTYSAHTAMFNLLGLPAVSVPCGFLDGLPVGLQIAALPGREDTILRVAQAVQRICPIAERPASAV
ncbi:amidase [Streptomyces sp. NPDC051985]|uniref:amidase n=1 Tax=Streptomyces sp. NPDC051985 TaxID=3155807 RepID=UPI003445A450